VPITVNVNGCPELVRPHAGRRRGLKGMIVLHEGRQRWSASRFTSAAPRASGRVRSQLRAHKGCRGTSSLDYVERVTRSFLTSASPRELRPWVQRADDRCCVSARMVPFHCPYCAEEDLRPHGEKHGDGECRACCGPSAALHRPARAGSRRGRRLT
jgi:hypothetical protein